MNIFSQSADIPVKNFLKIDGQTSTKVFAGGLPVHLRQHPHPTYRSARWPRVSAHWLYDLVLALHHQ